MLPTTTILVTGAPRSGNTFTGKMLALPKNVGYIRESFNHNGIPFRHQFEYIHETNPGFGEQTRLLDALFQGKMRFRRNCRWDSWTRLPKNIIKLAGFRSGCHASYLKALHHPRIDTWLMKDPLACLSAEYLHRSRNAKTLVLIRHPAAFVASMKRVGWEFDSGEDW